MKEFFKGLFFSFNLILKVLPLKWWKNVELKIVNDPKIG